MDGGTPWWEVLSAVAAAAGALAAAGGAWAAFRAARASERTSLESQRALAAATRPRLIPQVMNLEQDDRWKERGGLGVVVHNLSEWDASDVEVEVRYLDGERILESTETLAAHDADPFVVSIRPPAELGHFHEGIERFAVRYSDRHRIARHERVVVPDHDANTDHYYERQISGP